MAEYTTNFNLEKQQGNEYVSIEGLNANFDTIDTELKEAQDKAEQAFTQASNGKEVIKNAITGVDPSITIPADATFAQLATAIEQIETGIDTEDATATAEQILANMTAYVKGAKVTGSMTNRGAVNQSLAVNGTYTIPSGYHNGSGKVTQSITTKGAATITPSTTDQTIAANQYLTGIQTIKGDANLLPANILQGKNIFGVSGSVIAGKYTAGVANVNLVVSGGGCWFGPQGVNGSGTHKIIIVGLAFHAKFVKIVLKYGGPERTMYGFICQGSKVISWEDENGTAFSCISTVNGGLTNAEVLINSTGFTIHCRTYMINSITWEAWG